MIKQDKLTIDEVKHIAKLANLTLSEEEIKKFQLQLSKILDYIEVLSQIDTSKVEPTSQVTGLKNVFNKNNSSQTLSQTEALKNVSDSYNNYVKVGAIFNEE